MNKKRLIPIVILFLLQSRVGITQTKVSTVEFLNQQFRVVTALVDEESYDNFEIVDDNYNRSSSLITYDSVFFYCNPCVYQKQTDPIGLYIQRSQMKYPINRGNGPGNFYLKPNGILFFKDKIVGIVDTDDYRYTANEVDYAIQSGPMLVKNNQINSHFGNFSTNMNYRTGVGIYVDSLNKKYLIFANAVDPVNFYTFARLFKEYFKCSNALCLSCGDQLFFPPEQNKANVKSIPNGIFLKLKM